MTLYAYTKDTADTSTCYDQCATNWPALTATNITVGAGLDASAFKLIDRTDGTKQVSIAGHPLYFFAKDKAAGDVNGQKVGNVWYVVKADGSLIQS